MSKSELKVTKLLRRLDLEEESHIQFGTTEQSAIGEWKNNKHTTMKTKEKTTVEKLRRDLKTQQTQVMRLSNVKEIDYNAFQYRSEERRVGKECRTRRWPYHTKKKRVDEGVVATST